MYHQFNIAQLYDLPTMYIYVCIYLRTNSDLCHLLHKLIGFYKRDEKFLQRCTLWCINCSFLDRVFKWIDSQIPLSLTANQYNPKFKCHQKRTIMNPVQPRLTATYTALCSA